uniref:Uncharacterized protein n=1 Tax=Arundo donax TaxID=35708 RepID=A0A0A9U841_ARUDO
MQNEALLLKHLHKFYNKHDIPWINLIWNTHYNAGQILHALVEKGSFWWKDILRFSDHFRGIAAATAGNGSTILLWQDVCNGSYLKEELPRLFSFVRNDNISLQQFLHNPTPHDNFHVPLSMQALEELQVLQTTITQI